MGTHSCIRWHRCRWHVPRVDRNRRACISRIQVRRCCVCRRMSWPVWHSAARRTWCVQVQSGYGATWSYHRCPARHPHPHEPSCCRCCCSGLRMSLQCTRRRGRCTCSVRRRQSRRPHSVARRTEAVQMWMLCSPAPFLAGRVGFGCGCRFGCGFKLGGGGGEVLAMSLPWKCFS